MPEIHDLNPTDASNTARFPENQAPSTVNNGARALEGLIARYFFDNDTSVEGTLSGSVIQITANRDSLTLTGTTSNYVANFMQAWTQGATANPSPCSLNVDAVGPIALRDNRGATLSSSVILSGTRCLAVKDNANNYFRLIWPHSENAPQVSDVLTTEGDVLYQDGSGLQRLAVGTAGQALVVNSGATAPEWGAAGRVVQVVNVQDGASATGTTVMPGDNTIPQNTEGDEYMTLAITPTNASNTLLIEVVVHVSNSASGNTVISVALFQDSTADALASSAAHDINNSSRTQQSFRHKMTAGTTSSTTFKVRIGGASAGTTTFNGAIHGGVLASSITITEIAV